jgi:hypothetical protein
MLCGVVLCLWFSMTMISGENSSSYEAIMIIEKYASFHTTLEWIKRDLTAA